LIGEARWIQHDLIDKCIKNSKAACTAAEIINKQDHKQVYCHHNFYQTSEGTTMIDPNIPAQPGMPVSDIDTPALVIELDTFEKNIRTMADFCRQKKINLRPHAKTHKSVDIAKRQIAHGAVGICCQKISEAEVFVNGGISDVFVTNEIVGPKKLSRLVSLAQRARISVCVDNLANIADLGQAARQAGTDLNAFLEVDIGGGRCGVQPGSMVLELVRAIHNSPQLKFQGLQVYYGKAQHIRDYTQRRDALRQSLEKVAETLQLLEESGFTCPVVSGAGTGSYRFEAASGIYNELQCGSYIFMDVDYGSIHGEHGNLLDSFANSLFVLAGIMSKPSPGMAVCDAGLKAHSIDSGLPTLRDRPSISYRNASDEHGVLLDSDNSLSLGDKVYLVPGHCDPTVNLHDWYVGVRNGFVESIWKVSARGMIL
jgi:3-hydroxy-D-aspartate aldolase